nr:MAG TPA: hypothetical protein [Caudoviricetes sp.]
MDFDSCLFENFIQSYNKNCYNLYSARSKDKIFQIENNL